ncbi:MAG: outer membrane lipoprotein-sorting protein [Acidobacteria bacterium]|jgi:outer membrane lipoprotein-sorting protein|nr:outer membrane lipoprotein-sorting protein [Acidobacteriota bacterium]
MKKQWMVCLMAACWMAPATLVAQNAQKTQLDKVLDEMNVAAAHFRSTAADFNADMYTAVVQQHEKQSGTIAFRRVRSSMEMKVQITNQGGEPANRELLYKNGILDYYEPELRQETIISAGKNRETYESLLTIGFGGSGRELAKDWQVTFEGWETLDGVKVAKLNLVSNSQKVRDNFSHILLWMDPLRSIAYKQMLFMSSGDTRTVTYSKVRYNAPLPDSVFRIKVAPGTKKIVK